MAQDATAAPRPDTTSTSSGVHRPSFSPRPPIQVQQSFENTSTRSPLDRRRSSLVSLYSLDGSRQSLRSSTESLLLPKATDGQRQMSEEITHWHSAPLALAILPAVGGLFFKNGGEVVTDVCLLGLAAVFLNWSVGLPWEWYHAAQAVQTYDPELEHMDTIFEEDSEDGGVNGCNNQPAEVQSKDQSAVKEGGPKGSRNIMKRHAASDELRKRENLALLACFLGPMLGTYLLHAIRSQLSRPSEGLVSDFNLTIFLLTAELRPCSHVIRLMQARTLHLQRIVRRGAQAADDIDSEQLQALSKRLEDVETRLADLTSSQTSSKDGKDASLADITNIVRQNLQPQVDALNRAVRRYEKRATTQSIQTEARLQDLEARLKDALSLAAAAAQSGQKPGVIVIALEWLSILFVLPLQILWSVSIHPWQVMFEALVLAKSWVFPSKLDKKRREKTKYTDLVGTNGSRMQTKSTRR